jgi:hypothetical protein
MGTAYDHWKTTPRSERVTDDDWEQACAEVSTAAISDGADVDEMVSVLANADDALNYLLLRVDITQMPRDWLHGMRDLVALVAKTRNAVEAAAKSNARAYRED